MTDRMKDKLFFETYLGTFLHIYVQYFLEKL